jgi:hypothetical protein
MTIIPKIAGYRSRVINALIDAISRQRPVAGAGLIASETPTGTILSVARSPARLPEFPFGKDRWLFGIEIAGAEVTVGVGALRRAGSIYTSAETDITITADGDWIGWEFDPSDNTLAIIGPETSMPADGDGLMRGPLYQFSWIDATSSGPAYAILRTVWQHGLIVSNLFGE